MNGRALEERADVEPLEALHHERRSLLPKHSKLWALYGPGGTADDRRKAYLAVIALELRQGPPVAGAKGWTDGLLDTAARADTRYREFLDKATSGRAKLKVLETRLSEIEDRIESREVELRAYTAEMRMTR